MEDTLIKGTREQRGNLHFYNTVDKRNVCTINSQLTTVKLH
jgi:hypothetical protein